MTIESEVKTINVKYKKSKEFKKVPVTGVWGGPGPNGDIICNFFVEENDIPESIEVRINMKTGEHSEVQHHEGKNATVRELQVALVMRPDIAKVIGKWLIEKADVVLSTRPGLNIV